MSGVTGSILSLRRRKAAQLYMLPKQGSPIQLTVVGSVHNKLGQTNI